MKNHAFRKLSRTSSHRQALVRNLITSLFEHGRITTTVAKAKEAAREAEKVITLGKRNTNASMSRAQSILYSTGDSLKQLKLLSERYAERPGGYTRIHLHGNRKGDHAPRAILELVDGPRDLRLEITARAIARQTLQRSSSSGGAAHNLSDYANGKPYSAADFSSDLVLERFHPLTALNIRKATRFGGAPALAQLASKVNAAIVWQRAERAFEGAERRPDAQRMQAWAENAPRGSELKGAVVTRPYMGKKSVAGEEHLGSTGTPASQRLVRRGQEVKHSVIRLGKGVFAKRPRNRRTAFVPPPLPSAGAAQRVSA